MLGPVTPSVPLRVPRHSGSDVEAVLADANHRARQASLDRLAVALPGIDVAALAQTSDGAAAAAGRWQGPGSVTEQPLDPDAALERALIADATSSARLVDADDQRALPRAPDERRDLLDAGWTLLVDSFDDVHAGLPVLLDDLARAFGAPVSTTVEVATASSRGESPVGRPADHLFLQLIGSQQRFVRRPTHLSPHPLVPESSAVTQGPELDCTAGTAVHLPRGWHALRIGREEPSVAVEVAIHRPTVIDVLHQLADLAAGRPLLRADVPFDAERPHSSYAGSVMADPNLWTAEFGGLVDWPGFDQALATIRARIPRSSLPDDGDHADAPGVRNQIPGGVMLGPSDERQVVIAAGGVVAAVAPGAVADVGELVAPSGAPGRRTSRLTPLRDALSEHGWIRADL